MARPTVFTESLADEICERLVEGESLRRICKRAHMPSVSTVCRWLADEARAPFREQYARAREAQADTIADEILMISDTPKVGRVTTHKETTGGENPGVETKTVKGDMLGHRRLQIDARKWLAAKLAPKKYGERLELGGEIGLKTVSAEPLQDDEWAAKHTPA